MTNDIIVHGLRIQKRSQKQNKKRQQKLKEISGEEFNPESERQECYIKGQ